MADAVYRTLTGAIQFDPQEADVNGKDILRFSIRATGVKEQAQLVSCTLWPSHKESFSKLKKGSIVMVEGKYSVNNGTKEGNPVTYHNLSITGLAILGELDPGEREETTSTGGGDAAADEDW
jgi:hypothetical protein